MRQVLNFLIYVITFACVMPIGFWVNMAFIQSTDTPIPDGNSGVWWLIFTVCDLVVVYIIWRVLRINEKEGECKS